MVLFLELTVHENTIKSPIYYVHLPPSVFFRNLTNIKKGIEILAIFCDIFLKCRIILTLKNVFPYSSI